MSDLFLPNTYREREIYLTDPDKRVILDSEATPIVVLGGRRHILVDINPDVAGGRQPVVQFKSHPNPTQTMTTYLVEINSTNPSGFSFFKAVNNTNYFRDGMNKAFSKGKYKFLIQAAFLSPLNAGQFNLINQILI